MKIELQLQLELGEVAWAVRDRLGQTVPLSCLCYKKGEEVCCCGKSGSVYFQKVPVDVPTADEMAGLEIHKDKCC